MDVRVAAGAEAVDERLHVASEDAPIFRHMGWEEQPECGSLNMGADAERLPGVEWRATGAECGGMAKHTIVRACGHTEVVTIRGSKERLNLKLGRERARTCRPCYVERQRAQAEVAATAEGLPALTGTPKQIAWAITLRHKALSDAEAYLDYLRESDSRLEKASARNAELFEAKKERVLEPLRAQPEAAWWIDRRHDSPETLMTSLWADEA